jgi:MOSC domain-containing protein YiiM
MSGVVHAVSLSPSHTFTKPSVDEITLLEGLGVEGDAHCGVTVKHRSRVTADPSQPNLRQVHLIHSELFAMVGAAGYVVRPGEMGENITTEGIDLLGLAVGTRLRIADAVIAVTGLRNPCEQINGFQSGLLKQVLRTDPATGGVVRLAGIMGTVARGGIVRPGDRIEVDLPPAPHFPLTRV